MVADISHGTPCGVLRARALAPAPRPALPALLFFFFFFSVLFRSLLDMWPSSRAQVLLYVLALAPLFNFGLAAEAS
jgi:hypothetical protein